MNEIEKRQKQTMQDYFVKQVEIAVDGMSGAVSSSEAKRLTYNLVTAAQDNIAKSKNGRNPFTWNQQNIHNFLTKVIMHVSAGLDASNDEVYAFPYGQEMSVQPSYKGHRKLIKEYAVGKPVVDLKCFTVRENEEFIVEYGATEDKWEYKSKVFNNAPVLGYVTVLVHEDGTSRVMEHTLEEIEKRRFAGISGNSPAWKNWEVEMSRAKAIKRHAKTVDIKLRQDIQDLVSKIEKSDYEIYEVEETKIQLPESEDSPQRVEDGEEHHVARWVGESEEEVEPEEDVPEVDPEDESWIE